jgi:hypothetical protein
MPLLKSDQICHAISSILTGYVKSTISLLQSLSSNTTAQSVIELSENAQYGHHYSSISKSVSGLSHDETSHGKIEESLQKIYMDNFPAQSIYIFQTDTTPIIKAHSPKMADRQYIQIPNNVIAGNKSLSIGYKYSYVNLGYRPPQGSRWSLPLSVKRVTSETTSIETAIEQTNSLLKNSSLPFGKAPLVIQTMDSGYCTPKLIAPLVESYDNLAIIVRFRHGSKVWQQAPKESANSTKKRGTPTIYGDTTYYLQAHTGLHATKNGKTKEISSKMRTAIYDLPCNECLIVDEKTSRGRALKIEIRLWKNLMIRAKEGNNMKDKPFNLISVQVMDAQTGELVFQNPCL